MFIRVLNTCKLPQTDDLKIIVDIQKFHSFMRKSHAALL